MDAFEEILESDTPLPGGLFWLHRGEGDPLPRVCAFLQKAAGKLGAEAGLVRVQNFDETMRDLVRATHGLNTAVLDAFAAERRWRTPAPSPHGRKGWPVIRLNALPLEAPTVCRRVACQIGGTREVRDAVQKAGVDVLVARRQGAVLAFGSDLSVKAAFGPYTIADFDLHTIAVGKLRYDSAERGLLRDALTRALARGRKMRAKHARTRDSLVPDDPQQPEWLALKKIVGSPLHGPVPGVPDLSWSEGVAIRLDWANDRLWLVFEPRIVFDGRTDENAASAADFGRERTVRRYNRQLNDLLGFWAGLLAGEGQPLSALGIGDGVDASFRISPETSYSKRANS